MLFVGLIAKCFYLQKLQEILNCEIFSVENRLTIERVDVAHLA